MKYKLWLKLLVRCGLLVTLVGVSGISTASGGVPLSPSPKVAQHAGLQQQPSRWVPTGSMNEGRESHTATLLLDGKVLVAGGHSDGISLNSAEVYDPATGAWTATGSLDTGRRSRHTATLLPDGKVLVAGGHSDGISLNSAEVYDPATGA